MTELFNPFRSSRRQLLKSVSCGFGYLAFAGLCAENSRAAESPFAARVPHFPARAKRVIFLFMHGGPSQVDTFDYKPILAEQDGKKLPFEAAPNVSKSTAQGRVMRSPWKFSQHGESGLHVSELFPHVAEHVDDLCMLHSVHTEGQSHGQAVMKLHTGENTFVRPSVGSWVTYGLGTENQELPGFITICPTRNHGGVRNYGSAFLPAAFQGTPIGYGNTPAKDAQIRYLSNSAVSPALQRKQFDFIQELNRKHLQRADQDTQVEGVIESFELAYGMQSSVPQVMDISHESKDTRALYGIGEKTTDNFGRQCLLARRFAESGVRYIEVAHADKWDQHSNLKNGHQKNALEVDRPIAGLLADLKQRGLLEDTLVVWSGEFGRTPAAQGKDGRDHNPQGFTVWMAGGGVRGGFSYGATDEFGYYAVEDKVHMHDLHATMLHLMGVDHKGLTYRHNGRDFRLTDVHGRVVHDIFS